MIFSVSAFVWASHAAGVEWTPANLLYLVSAALGGALILSAAVIATGAMSFWTTRSNIFYWALVFPARNLTYYPINIYARPLQALLTFVLPFAFINYYPTHVFLGRESTLFHPIFPFLTPLIGVVCFWGAYKLWQAGTARYTGTGN